MSQFNLSIKSPCSEKWESFQKNCNTGYCSSCKKNVVDFTTYTDREIIEFFKKNKGNICGRLRDDQLKTYRDDSKSSYHKIAAVLASGILMLTQTPNVFAQTTATLSGKVVDHEKLPLPGTHVGIKGTTERTLTNADGNYQLNYSGTQNEVTVVFSFLGYVTYEKIVDLTQKEVILYDILLHEAVLKEITVDNATPKVNESIAQALTGKLGGLRVSRPSLWNRITSIFRR